MTVTSNLTFSDVFDATKHKAYHAYGKEKCITPWTFFINYNGVQYLPIHSEGSKCGFKTPEQAEDYKRVVAHEYITNKYVYLVMRDYDAGGSHSRIDKVFSNNVAAHEYIMSQEGIMGSEQRYILSFGVNIHGGLYGSYTYNGFSIKQHRVYSTAESVWK